MGLVRVKTLLLLLIAAAVIATAITTTNFAGHLTAAENVTGTKPDPHLAVNIPGKESFADEAPSNIQVVLFALHAEGFEPAEMQLPAGEYLFVVRNRTGLDEVNVRLVSENSQQMLAARVGLRRQDLKRRLHLEPGTYRLTETDHPDWTCTLVISQ
jgi:hypothetical protein